MRSLVLPPPFRPPGGNTCSFPGLMLGNARPGSSRPIGVSCPHSLIPRVLVRVRTPETLFAVHSLADRQGLSGRTAFMGTEQSNTDREDGGGALPDIPLALLRANDATAWQSAQRILWERMWRAVHRKMPLATESQLSDLVSEILCDPVVAQLFEPESDAFRALRTFSDLVNLACHIAGLRAIDKIRQSVRRGPHIPLEDEALPPVSPGGDESDAIQSALLQIEDRYREPLLLHYFEGLGTQAIADRLTLPKGTVCTLLSRGREAIRKVLEQDGFPLSTAPSP